MKRFSYGIITLVLIVFIVAPLPNISSFYSLKESGENQTVEANEQISTKDKFEHGFWDKVQELKTNGTTGKLSVIIRLVRGTGVTSMQIEELKNYTASLLQSSHNASVYYKCKILPVIMARIPIAEIERVAEYDFVESLGDGERKVYTTLDVSRQAIEADNVEAILGYNGSGITIAILDTGINSSHPDLNDLDDNPATNDPKVIDEISFVDWDDDGVPDVNPMDNHGHGTHVAGIAAGTGEASNYQFVGVAPGAWLMNVKVLMLVWVWDPVLQMWVPVGTGQVDDAVAGIDWAMSQEVDVISMSLGAAGGDGLSELSKAADDAVDAGIVVVVAAGNDGPGGQTITSLGDAFNVITVGASDDNNSVNISDDTLWQWSSRGPTSDLRTKPDVVAPGANIISSVSMGSAYWQTFSWLRVGNLHARMWGTSMATPHVSGTAALLLEAHPDWTPNLVKDALKRTARLNTNLQGLSENDRGRGIVDAFAAVQASPDGTFGWDPYTVRSRDETTVVYNVTRVENVPSLRNIQLSGVQIANMVAAPYLWLASQEHKLNDSLLVSGPRVDSKTSTSAGLKIVYSVDGLKIIKFYSISKMGIESIMAAQAIFSWLGYYDLDLRGPDHDYATWTNGSIIWNEAKLHNTAFHYNDTQYSELWIFFSPNWREADADNWILRHHGGFSNNPDNYKNNESIYDTNLVIYQKTHHSVGLWSGPLIHIIHDIAVTSVTTVLPYGATAVYSSGWWINIYVTVKNEGTQTETFNVTAYASTTIIDTQTVTNLAPNQNTTLTFVWTVPTPPSWTPYPPQYTISAEADVVPGETDTADNIFVDGSITVKHPGDVNGDGSVDSTDYALFGEAWPPNPYDPNCDFNCDGVIDSADLGILALNWGWHV